MAAVLQLALASTCEDSPRVCSSMAYETTSSQDSNSTVALTPACPFVPR
jgi:hypothetical protein